MKTSPAPANSTGGPSPPPQAHPVQTLPPFLSKCYDMVDDPSTDGTVSWSAGGDSFVVWDPHSFSRDLLPKYFKHNNLSSFVRQLNTYGFHKVDPDRWEFANNGFLRGQKHLLKTIISRKKTTQNVVQPKPSLGKTTPVKACVEVGKFGLEEEMERLKRDKNVLMQELVKLRQHQQLSDSEVCSLKQRLKVMELQQQQMLSFLAMAMQSPGFLAQFLQQNGNNRWRAEPNKKRRLPALEEGEYAEEAVSDVQIVRYQPTVTENSEPLPERVLNTEVTHEPNSLSVGVNGMFMNDATLYGADSDGQIVRYHPTVTEISDPLPERVLNTEVTHEPDSLSVGVNDMFMNDVTLYGEDSSFQAEEEFLFDIPDDLTQLLDNLLSENNIETETYDMENSVIGKDNELPQYKIEFGTPQNLVLTDEQMVAENTVTQMDNKIV